MTNRQVTNCDFIVENTLLLTNESGLSKIPTKIHQIIDVTTWAQKN